MCSTCWYLHCEEQLELLHNGWGGGINCLNTVFYNQTFQVKNVPYQKERHIEASAKVNEKTVPNLYLSLMLIVIAPTY